MRHARERAADCEILKLAHHGSHNGTDRRWLALVNPELAVASLGAGNEYGHPHRETLELLASQGIDVLRTDQRGSIVVTTDGAKWSVQAERNNALSRTPDKWRHQVGSKAAL